MYYMHTDARTLADYQKVSQKRDAHNYTTNVVPLRFVELIMIRRIESFAESKSTHGHCFVYFFFPTYILNINRAFICVSGGSYEFVTIVCVDSDSYCDRPACVEYFAVFEFVKFLHRIEDVYKRANLTRFRFKRVLFIRKKKLLRISGMIARI